MSTGAMVCCEMNEWISEGYTGHMQLILSYSGHFLAEAKVRNRHKGGHVPVL